MWIHKNPYDSTNCKSCILPKQILWDSITMNKDGSKIYIGGRTIPNIFLSEDFGKTWKPLNIGYISSIVCDDSGNIIYIITYDLQNIRMTKDGGNSWVELNQKAWNIDCSGDGQRIIVKYDDGHSSNNIGISTDMGLSWNTRSDSSIKDIKMSRDGRKSLIVSEKQAYIYDNDTKQIQKTIQLIYGKCGAINYDGRIILLVDNKTFKGSYDGGYNWSEFKEKVDIKFISMSEDGNIISAVSSNNEGGKMYISRNGFDNLSQIPESRKWTDTFVSSNGKIIMSTILDQGIYMFIPNKTKKNIFIILILSLISLGIGYGIWKYWYKK